MAEIENIGTEANNSWNRFLEALMRFPNNRMADEPLAKTIADGLEVFRLFPEAQTVSIFWLDQESFEFRFGASRPETKKIRMEEQFTRLVESGAIAGALESVRNGEPGFYQTMTGGRGVFLIYPLVVPTGILGMVLVELGSRSDAIPPQEARFSGLGVQQLGHLLYNKILSQKMNNQKGVVDQKVALRTQDLEKNRRELRSILDSVNAGVVIVDTKNYRILEVNQTAMEIIGLSKEEIIGSFCHQYMCVLEKGRCPVIDFSQPIENTEQVLIKGNRQSIPIVKKVSPIFWGGRKCLMESFIDISELKFLEEQFHQSLKLEAIARMAGGVAHDFNNLLMAIMGYSDLILMNPSAGEGGVVRQVREIKKAAQKAADLTQQLLALNRKQVVEPKVLDLNVIIIDLEKILGRLMREEVELVTALDPTLANITGDRGQMEQVIVNLAINARDAMSAGGKLTIETTNVAIGQTTPRRYPVMPVGNYALLAVSDNGKGMDVETKSHVFEPFFTTKEWGKGTGMGLSTVYGIVRQSGGYIWVYSEVGKGTTIKIYFPQAEGFTSFASAGAGSGKVVPGSETILLVEDEELLRTPIREILERQGYSVLEASNGEEALVTARQYPGPIDLLLSDIVMPGMNGRDLAGHLSRIRPDLKVLFMSGYTHNAIVHHGVLEEGLAFLEKPFTPEALAVKIRQVLRSLPPLMGDSPNGSSPRISN